ncbi:EAL domain-containing protein [Acidovorax sp. SRB_24]|uniref:EAL domain-containing protein n=1 Tax=Acidovorax sp. SRB_24 TaxID=1962700 RepID=UPI00145E51DB|nr:EAL domain-containing protein [Acidovorax sp. SRB_24]NMM76689.1 diguanylate cyclase [Acidovorax sp. SRB_24]
MPVSVLLIEGCEDHAQAVVRALADPWLGWRVAVAPTLSQAHALREQHSFDIVLTAQRVSDGTAFDVLQGLADLPALIVVPEGEEAHAAQAMRHGFGDYAVQDPGHRYLLALPAQMESVLERSTGMRTQRNAEQMLERQHRLLQAISRAQALFIASASPRAAFEALLQEMLRLTHSAFGVVGQVEHVSGGAPRLHVHAVSDLGAQARDGTAWDPPQALVDATLRSATPLIRNDPASDPGATGRPPGQPELTAFLGLPIHAAGQLVAMVGVANRPDGYGRGDVHFLQPLLNTVGQLEMARRAEAERRAMEAQLTQTSALLAEKTRALELTLGSVAQGIATVDQSGRIRLYNQRYLDLLDLPRPLLEAQPHLDDVVRLQIERGDTGAGFAFGEPGPHLCPMVQGPALPRWSEMRPLQVQHTRTGHYLEMRLRRLEGGGGVLTCTDVTDYLQAQAALQQSEARWRSLTQLSSDWYWEQDAEFRFVRLEGGTHRHGGMADTAHYGLRRWELPDSLVPEAQWQAHRAQLEAHEVFHDFEMQRRGADGHAVWVSVSGEPIHDAAGRFTGYRGVARNINARKQAEAQIERLAFYDELTGLPNRRLLLDRLDCAVTACTRDGSHGALLFLDLDNFKGVNDTLGHEWGDRLLVQVGARLTACVRASDTVGRLGGDEFVVVLRGLHTVETEAAGEAEAVAHKMLLALNHVYDVHGLEMHSTPSLGIALFSGVAQSVQELLKRADLAMYQAKAQGRNTLCFFDPDMQAAASARSALEADVRQGLQRGEFLVHYQPVVDAEGHVLGTETLVRWQHPQRGMVYPGEFIALAEQTGLILPLGRQVLRAACVQLAQWNALPATAHWSVAVNVSAQEFRHPEFVQRVLEVLHDTGAPPAQLKLELTESLLLHDVEDSIAKMQALRTRGVGFSLDDFGTGYSSLSYLKRLPLDQLKIDQSFVRDVLTDPNDAAIACTVVALARSLGLDVVAEGVETAGQRDFLLRNGCRRFQGYLFGRPVPAQDLRVR